MTLQALIQKMKDAGGPDRELDVLIQAEQDNRDVIWDDNEMLGRYREPPHDTCRLGAIDPGAVRRNFSEAWSLPPPPKYTSSIDVALSLIPEGIHWMLGYGRVREGEPLGACGFIKPGAREPYITEEAATVPLAICIAALEARQKMKEAM